MIALDTFLTLQVGDILRLDQSQINRDNSWILVCPIAEITQIRTNAFDGQYVRTKIFYQSEFEPQGNYAEDYHTARNYILAKIGRLPDE